MARVQAARRVRRTATHARQGGPHRRSPAQVCGSMSPRVEGVSGCVSLFFRFSRLVSSSPCAAGRSASLSHGFPAGRGRAGALALFPISEAKPRSVQLGSRQPASPALLPAALSSVAIGAVSVQFRSRRERGAGWSEAGEALHPERPLGYQRPLLRCSAGVQPESHQGTDWVKAPLITPAGRWGTQRSWRPTFSGSAMMRRRRRRTPSRSRQRTRGSPSRHWRVQGRLWTLRATQSGQRLQTCPGAPCWGGAAAAAVRPCTEPPLGARWALRCV